MNLSQQTLDFFNRFRSNHVLLLIGQGISDDEITRYLADNKWSCVLTTRKDSGFSSLFVTDSRTPREYCERSEIPNKALHRVNMPILRLAGLNTTAEDDDDLPDWLKDDSDSQLKTREMLQFLPNLMDHINSLVVTGLTDEDLVLLGKSFASILYKHVTAGTVAFWGMKSPQATDALSVYSALEQTAQAREFTFTAASLSDIIKTRRQDTDALDDEDTLTSHSFADDDIYYQAGQSVHISSKEKLQFKNLGTLLTDRLIYERQPLGRVQSQQWFSNFLELSSVRGPQWYGYLDRSTFYVKRSFEDALVQTVLTRLEGKGVLNDSPQDGPIILSGDPGSSKSITLGALAYRIYKAHVNPVIYIEKETFLQDRFEEAANELHERMKFLEDRAPKSTRVLVVWDSSSFHGGLEQVKKLWRYLFNHGRRFVLVCSGYRMPRDDDNSNITSCSWDKSSRSFVSCPSDSAQVVCSKDTCFVRSTRSMNGEEIRLFWNLIRNYSGISEVTINAIKQSLNGNDQIFEYFYRVISVLRDNLVSGLNHEQEKVFQYVHQELEKVWKKEVSDSKPAPAAHSAFYQAFLDAGLDPAAYGVTDDAPSDSEDNDTMAEDLAHFNICVALFSRFKLQLPSGLAYTILFRNDESFYSSKNSELFRLVTTSIPWLYYGETDEGDYCFQFRNSLEAEIFLQTHDVSGEKQIDILCEIIDIYGRDYQRCRCVDLNFTTNLQQLIRLMGPNSPYTVFHCHEGRAAHENILKQLDKVICAIQRLFTEYGVPDADAGFATIIVTFTREYYSGIWNNRIHQANMEKPWVISPDNFSQKTYELRIQRLLDAIALADESMDHVDTTLLDTTYTPEKQRLSSVRNTLAVERAQCGIRLERLYDEYLEFCTDTGSDPAFAYEDCKLQYRHIYRQLEHVISSDPINGYAYNALFSAFERMYQKSGISESTKLQYLSDIMQVINTCKTLDTEIVNRGTLDRDELSDHIVRINGLATKLNVTLDDALAHLKGEPTRNDQEAAFFTLYDEMVSKDNPAAILFLCQKELNSIRSTYKLKDHEISLCKKVRRFLTNPIHMQVVSSTSYGLAFLIRVSWMCYNETTLSAFPECQLTRLTREQWQDINQLCAAYQNTPAEIKQPIITLLYALSTLQVAGFSQSSYQDAISILNTIDANHFYQARLRTPFMLCDSEGKALTFRGKVLRVQEKKTGFIEVDGLPKTLGGFRGVRFHHLNLGRRKPMPTEQAILKDLELGIGYTSFSVYQEEGRQEKESKS